MKIPLLYETGKNKETDEIMYLNLQHSIIEFSLLKT